VDAKDIILSILTSTVVSGGISLALKAWFEQKLESQRHSYSVELEKLKMELAIKAGTVHELAERKIVAYPKIVELVYRIRNMAREISNNPGGSDVLPDELNVRTHELEDSLFTYRIDLQRDQAFTTIHGYKNRAITFNKLFKDYSALKNVGDEQGAGNPLSQLQNLYSEIEEQHRVIIDQFSGILATLEQLAATA
jgi:hypothetical protein